MTLVSTFAARGSRTFIALAVVLAFSGCASIVPPSRLAVSPAMNAFSDAIDMGGRLSIRYQQNGKDEVLHGSFMWSQTAGHTTVTLLSPLGQTIAVIDVTPTSSTLTQSGQAPRAAGDVDALVAETLGWPLPIAGLRSWLQGFAVDAEGRNFVATPQTAESVTTRDGWRIRYAGWEVAEASPSRSHPKRIDLERGTGQAGDVSIRIAIDNWQTH